MLSIVIPIYNERDLWLRCLQAVKDADLPGIDRQIILVDDGSTDGTREQLASLAQEPPWPWPSGVSCTVMFHERNRGKGAALRTGFAAAAGEVVIVQDADLEYDPNDYPALVRPILDGQADAVYGNRFHAGRPPGMTPASWLANRTLTMLFNIIHGADIADMETCYKALRRDLLRRLDLRQDRFGFEPEVSSRLAKAHARIRQAPIRYRARTRREGKKIGLKDGFKTLWCIVRYGLSG